jgi:hypothetical protein
VAHPYESGWAALRRAVFAAKGRQCHWCGQASPGAAALAGFCALSRNLGRAPAEAAPE